ncbi:Methyl-accepting chemotaxis protein II [Hydrogenovibrio crunogenus]|uniref:Methyl-accepting chemotaxis protein II n=1 Tax=Hydrogenovibrio crunogenus TaxID=39765 RepID=A0A4P7NYF2_9GAMM|nr:methyl-accepting chemotaxis protein [Hydrogenovibrio crunogenus]QBZ82579.1 Methyl-accepting chemotaxis protein II [Hydrogenovibrio crunogenus]RUM92908.1 MAG: chemotaxis protein [Thiomicrospira sp.]
MGIKTRMFIGIFGAVLFLLMSNLVAQYIFGQTSKTVNEVVNENQVKVTLLNELKNLTDERAILSRDLVLTEKEDLIKSTKKRLSETRGEIGDVFSSLEKMSLDAKEKAFFEAIQQNVVAANVSFGSFMVMVDEDFKEDAADILMGEFGDKYQAFTDIVADFKQYEEQKNTRAVQELVEQEQIGVISLWSVMGVSVLIFSVAGFFVARSFLKPIIAMRETMTKITQTGELNHRVEIYSKDELGETSVAINNLLETIHDAISDVNSLMGEVSQGVFERTIEHEYEGDFLTLKQGVNQSVIQIHNMVLMLRDTANNLRNGVLEPVKSNETVLSGDYAEVMNDIEVSMNRIGETVQDISKTLESLSRGDFSKRVTADARGEFVTLKNAINTTVEGLESFVEEVALVQTNISEGDLTKLVTGTYHGKMAVLKDTLNSSTRNISEMIGKVGSVTRLVADESRSIADGSESISTRIQQQTVSLERTSTQMMQMTNTVRSNADSANNANQMTQDAQKKLTEGVDIMQKALESMDKMSEASQKINDIITLIDGIAFQTNLLALNAAVEAARAGDHGRGFAVVAGEVRNLAGKSSDAAAEIKKLIENSVAISDQSGHYVKETSDALSQLNTSMDEISSMISTIAKASNEQAAGIDNVSQAISEIDSTTQQNAGIVEEAAAGSQDLLQQSSDLMSLVQQFKVDTQVLQRVERIQESDSAKEFEKMVQAHLAWKSKIRAFVDGMDIGVTYEVATDPTACALGQWYYGEGQVYSDLPLMETLGKEHKEMHLAIKKVMDAKEIGDEETVDAELTQVDKKSEVVVGLLYQLIEEVG